jgi:hypothetical protein
MEQSSYFSAIDEAFRKLQEELEAKAKEQQSE